MMRMGLALTPRLRQVCECTACGQWVNSAPPGEIPRDPSTGQIHVVGCIELGICPVCLTRMSGVDGLSDTQLARIALFLRTRREKEKRT
jgi:hypothetical protein